MEEYLPLTMVQVEAVVLVKLVNKLLQVELDQQPPLGVVMEVMEY